LAGDELFIDLDLSADNAPPGTRIAIGSAIIEVTNQPHAGCQKFMARFGSDAMTLVNSPLGRRLQLRGINAKVVQPGLVRVGDAAKKLERLPASCPTAAAPDGAAASAETMEDQRSE
jgi:MOSC domain-containing protein YiiM